MTTVGFVTTELWPSTEGGAGRLNAELIDLLTRAGHDVHLVLVAAPDVVSVDPRVSVVHPTDSAGWDIGFMAASKAAADGLAELQRTNPLDRVEIQDFDGLAFWALTHRGDLGLASVPITIRFHGPTDLQTEAMGSETAELSVAGQMERESFAMADVTVVPSEGIRQLAMARYGLESKRVIIGPPVVRELPTVARDPSPDLQFLVIGRLSEVKGSHDMVAASVPLLRRFQNASVTFVGSDGWSVSANRPMREWLTKSIPRSVSDRIVFLESVDEDALARLIANATAVVVPSRFESFNLAVHEARKAGAPVVVPDIPAFSSILDESTGALVYDGSVQDLTRVLMALAIDPDVATDLERQPVPRFGDPLAPYDDPLPEVWHVRSQGGLATAALARVEAVRFPEPVVPLGTRLLQSAIRVVPVSVLDIARKALPNAVKDRLRDASDWGSEEERQEIMARWALIRERLTVDVSADIEEPLVSVVIPCFNHGIFIEEALLSVFEQTTADIEVIVVDDGSDDGLTPEMLDAFVMPRLSVIHQQNVGLPGARNTGIAAARGQYVVTLDADDELAPTYIETLLGAVAEDDGIAFAHCWAELHGDFQAIWATRPFNPYQLLLSNSVVGCVLLRKSAWAEVGGYDESMLEGNEDWDLWIRLTEAGYRSVQVREPLFRYRKHGVSMSVETEASYESALASLAERFPNIYAREHFAAMKQLFYPLLTVLTDSESVSKPFEDSQVIITSKAEMSISIEAVDGKYVVWWPEGTDADVSDLETMCDILEQDENLGAVETTSASPVRVVRTWSVRDPGAPSAVVVTEIEGSSTGAIACGHFPDPSWQVPMMVDGIPVQRQRPEEAGTIPAWVGV